MDKECHHSPTQCKCQRRANSSVNWYEPEAESYLNKRCYPFRPRKEALTSSCLKDRSVAIANDGKQENRHDRDGCRSPCERVTVDQKNYTLTDQHCSQAKRKAKHQQILEAQSVKLTQFAYRLLNHARN